MSPLIRRIAVLLVAFTFLYLSFRQLTLGVEFPLPTATSSNRVKGPIRWKEIPPRYTVASTIALPTGTPPAIPRIQHEFGVETQHTKAERLHRQAAVKEAFLHSWNGYKKHAWLQDEVTPVTGGFTNAFGQRGATLVDTLDTLAIMGLDDEFAEAVKAVKGIDFTTSAISRLNVFETTIRYLGGLLGAYDVSEAKHHVLLDKAIELGDMLYAAFDTPNRMPIGRWDWESAAVRKYQQADGQGLSAELGSLTLEFTRLTQLTGDPKYYDAVARITALLSKHQDRTQIPGLFPIHISPAREDFASDSHFTMGGMSDSLYEYLPKQHLLLNGLDPQYQNLFSNAMREAKQHLFFRPLNPQNKDILMSGSARISGATGRTKLDPVAQHLSCFAGGMVALGARVFNRSAELAVARKLVDGCIWAYDSTPSGIMPEQAKLIPCRGDADCAWQPEKWNTAVRSAGVDEFDRNLDAADIIKQDGLPPGFARISDRRYLLRPEAIESIFIQHRITGDPALADAAWRMFTSIANATRTPIAHSAIADVTLPVGHASQKLDQCESFWMAETLKYFYLVFSDPELVSLDHWVFNTEAHPLRRPQAEKRVGE
ncbi:glycoside hydrolase family 47 protein [Didymella exigua CBS 183.55]|uniref:alpha-1,2-Mannosidase n=1 Tax=Didymella exigua CBS 183.55 TaxID=1150837 RepID=A0A6A5RJ73_9PLEO|nr:glycoside hydrolase family 47 protein [Didymella exigua CBS 183.55]KAF1925657.1 glycoside hydrolase family 47 protein [Didymella exigua CBS 183.55]